MGNPLLGAVGVFVVIWTAAFVVGALYLGGGWAAVHRQARQIVLLTVLLAVVLVSAGVVIEAIGDLAVFVILLALTVALQLWSRRSRRAMDAAAAERRRAAVRRRSVRALMIVYTGGILVGTVVLAALTAR